MTAGGVLIIYLHGLNGSSESTKAAQFREALAPLRLVVPDYPAHRPDAAVAELTSRFAELAGPARAPAVIGSSMGAFYGQYLARRFPVSHLFLINPALQPWALLSDYEDVPMTTAAGIEYRLTADVIERTRVYGIAKPCDGDDDGVPTTLFLDEDDEVIDYRVAEALYRDCGRILRYPGGDHAFQHMTHAIGVVRATMTQLGVRP